jgi:hypothetical protein
MKRKAYSSDCWVITRFEEKAMATPSDTNFSPRPPAETDWLAMVREKVASLRYGVVQIVVHDGRVTQIERNEKTRLQTGREGQTEE